MPKAVVVQGDNACKHDFIKREKYNVSALHRVCNACGHEELISESQQLTDKELKLIAKVK